MLAWLKAKKDYVVAYAWSLYAQMKASWAMRGAVIAAAIGLFDQATVMLPESMRDTKLFMVVGFAVFVVRWFMLHKITAEGVSDLLAPAADEPAPVAVTVAGSGKLPPSPNDPAA